MAEETRDARRAAPRSIMGTVLCTAGLGLFYLLGLLFSTPDVTALDEPIQVPGPARPGRPTPPHPTLPPPPRPLQVGAAGVLCSGGRAVG